MFEGLQFSDNRIASVIETEMRFMWNNSSHYPYAFMWEELSVDEVNRIIDRIKYKGVNVADAILNEIGPAKDN